MADRRGSPGIWALLSLGQSRALLLRPRYLLLALGISLVYALVAMLVGGMLEIFWPPAHLTSYWVILPSGSPWWDYPGILAVNPLFVLSLPLLPTLFMVVTSAGVGLGMAVAVVLSLQLLRRRAASSLRPAGVGAAAGLTPAMIALVTLGACCSTTAAATAGIGLTAQATGTSASALLLNAWYLGVFQIAILYVALLAQEQLLTIYGSVVPLSARTTPVVEQGPPFDRRFVFGALLRLVLLAAGVTWALAMVADWLSVNPASAPPAVWTGWILQHLLVGFAAVGAALFPLSFLRKVDWLLGTGTGRVLRLLLAVAGISLAIGVPPPVAGWGWHGFLNELLANVGLPPAWGGVSPSPTAGVALGVRWATQYLLLGAFAILLGTRPEWALRPALWTVAGTRGTPEIEVRSGSERHPTLGAESRLALAPETHR